MAATVCRNNNGFTLIEVLVAMFVLLFGMLALLNTAAVVIDYNLGNVLRDEAVSVAVENMDTLKNQPFNSLAQGPFSPAAYSSSTVTRTFRGVSVNYTVTSTITQVGSDTLGLQVLVTWTHKGNAYQHSMSSVVNNVI
jgi:prepilin-type N-terminal cleavage/methylation domain-containing protein